MGIYLSARFQTEAEELAFDVCVAMAITEAVSVDLEAYLKAEAEYDDAPRYDEEGNDAAFQAYERLVDNEAWAVIHSMRVHGFGKFYGIDDSYAGSTKDREDIKQLILTNAQFNGIPQSVLALIKEFSWS